MRSKMRSKKASLELSINTIVIVVLALTLLGLGLAFIRSQIMNISESTTQVQEQIKQQILDDLRTGNKKLSFPTNELSTQSQGQVMVPIGVKNTGDSDLYFIISVDEITDPSAPVPEVPGTAEGNFFWDAGLQKLIVGEANVYGIKHFAYKAQQSYQFKITIKKCLYQKSVGVPKTVGDCKGELGDKTPPAYETYSSKTFFVKVT
jgi:hypothetical protein